MWSTATSEPYRFASPRTSIADAIDPACSFRLRKFRRRRQVEHDGRARGDRVEPYARVDRKAHRAGPVNLQSSRRPLEVDPSLGESESEESGRRPAFGEGGPDPDRIRFESYSDPPQPLEQEGKERGDAEPEHKTGVV